MRTRLSSLLVLGSLFSSFIPAAAAAEWDLSDDASFYVEAAVTHRAVPDLVYLLIDCSIIEPLSRVEIRRKQQELMDAFSTVVSEENAIVRNGSSLYLQTEYDVDTGLPIVDSGASKRYGGNFGFAVELTDRSTYESLQTTIDEQGCTSTWDARINQTMRYAREYRSELVKQINEKKAFYEELFGVTLDKVSNVSVSTFIDSGASWYYPAYDTETDSVMATTTMSVQFAVPSTAR